MNKIKKTIEKEMFRMLLIKKEINVMMLLMIKKIIINLIIYNNFKQILSLAIVLLTN